MPSRTKRSLALLVAALSALVLVAGACSDTDSGNASTKKDESSNTEASKKSDESENDSGDETDSTEAPEASPDFSKTVGAARKAIDDAKDSCELYIAVSALSTVGNPETKDQTREASDFYVAMLKKMADTSSDEATAVVLRNGADEFAAFAKKVDYDPDKMDLSGSGPEIKDSEKLDEAMNSYATTEFVKCELPGGTGTQGGSATQNGADTQNGAESQNGS